MARLIEAFGSRFGTRWLDYRVNLHFRGFVLEISMRCPREEQMGPNFRDVALMVGFREAVDLCGLDDLEYIGVDWAFEK